MLAFRLPPRRWAVRIVVSVLLGFGIGFGPFPAPPAQGTTPPDTIRLSFKEAVRTALDRNTDIKRAQSSARQSHTEARAEWLDFAPNLTVSTTGTRRIGRNFSQVTGDFTTRSTDFFSANGQSSLTLFNGFENVASLKRARRQAEADETRLKRTRREVVFTVVDQYITLIETREIVRVRREELTARRQQLQQIEAFVEAGSRPVSDRYQEEANVAEAEQRLLKAEREREVSRTRLIQTLQLNPRRLYRFVTPGLGSDTLTTPSYDVSALMTQAFQNRLDLRAREAERRAAEHGVTTAQSAYYPRITLSGRYSTDWTSRQRLPNPNNPNEGITPSFWDQLDNNRGGEIGLSLRIPIFDRFQRETRVERAQVEAQNAKYRLDDQRQRIALQVRQSYFNYRNAVQQLEASDKRLRAAKQALTSAQERYKLGSASIVELQNARRDFVEAASQQVRARYNLLREKKRIDYHTGQLSPDDALIGTLRK